MNTDLLFENARLQGRVITLEAEVKCLEAVIRSHERVDCLRIKSLDEQLKQAEAENARLKQSLRLQIEQNALAQVGFKMYQDNVDSGGLHKDRKDAIARLEAENARLKAEVEKWEKNTQLMGRQLNDELEQVARLKAEVERLTKMCQATSPDGFIHIRDIKHLNAAKEVQS